MDTLCRTVKAQSFVIKTPIPNYLTTTTTLAGQTSLGEQA